MINCIFLLKKKNNQNAQYIDLDESMDYFAYIMEEDCENCSSVS